MPDLRRPVCARCRRPTTVCYCAHIPHLPTRTQILLLQHPRERHVAIGTARMAHLSLPNSILRLGVDFSGDAVVQALASPDAATRAYVLFPGPTALDVAELPREPPITLIVLDGTWSLARKLLHLNPFLQTLPQVAFTPSRPSDYRIRRQPAAFCVSTIEALSEVLGLLEPVAGGPSGAFERLLHPFRAMVARQEHFIANVHTRRHHDSRRKKLGARPRNASLADRLRVDWSRIVCVQGEANAWPRRDPQRQAPEIIHWVASRPATGERYEAIVAPRRPIARSTARYSGLDEAALASGISLDDWCESWGQFARADDVLVSWGGFYLGLALEDGLALSARRMDLRKEVAQLRRGRFATIDDALSNWTGAAAEPGEGRAVVGYPASHAEGDPRPAVPSAGRAGRRLDTLVNLLGLLASRAAPGPGADECRLEAVVKGASAQA